MSEETSETLSSAIARLDSRQIEILLQFCVKWNTNSRTSTVAQRVFYDIIHHVTPTEFFKMPQAFRYAVLKKFREEWNQISEKIPKIPYKKLKNHVEKICLKFQKLIDLKIFIISDFQS